VALRSCRPRAGRRGSTVRATLAEDARGRRPGTRSRGGRCRSGRPRRSTTEVAKPAAARRARTRPAGSPQGAPPAAASSSSARTLRRAHGRATSPRQARAGGARLDIWRAPTDNDGGMHGDEQLEAAWRRHGSIARAIA
jgi:hypothetical protein